MTIPIKGVEHEIDRNELLIIRTATGRLKIIFVFDQIKSPLDTLDL